MTDADLTSLLLFCIPLVVIFASCIVAMLVVAKLLYNKKMLFWNSKRIARENRAEPALEINKEV
jgi:hypothetical protein